MKIEMDLLKKLREQTFAPLGDCKEALVESNGDLDAAREFLKKKGVIKAGKKADRETKEGLVKIISKDGRISGIKLMCETDFVAKNEIFLELLDLLLNEISNYKKSISSINEIEEGFRGKLNGIITDFVGKIGENVQIGEMVLTNEKAFVYNHPGNKVASVIFYNGDSDTIAKEIALQVVAMDPMYLDVSSVPEEYIKQLEEQSGQDLKDSGKPQDIVNQILKGRVSKALSESVLMEQEYIREAGKKVKDIVPAGYEIKKYLRIAI